MEGSSERKKKNSKAVSTAVWVATHAKPRILIRQSVSKCRFFIRLLCSLVVWATNDCWGCNTNLQKRWKHWKLFILQKGFTDKARDGAQTLNLTFCSCRTIPHHTGLTFFLLFKSFFNLFLLQAPKTEVPPPAPPAPPTLCSTPEPTNEWSSKRDAHRCPSWQASPTFLLSLFPISRAEREGCPGGPSRNYCNSVITVIAFTALAF